MRLGAWQPDPTLQPALYPCGARCQSGRPVPVDRADWKQYVAAFRGRAM